MKLEKFRIFTLQFDLENPGVAGNYGRSGKLRFEKV